MNDTPQSDANDRLRQRAELSALMDGQADAGDVQRCSAAWRDDADARARWHAYHLIGDVLRSDELAGSPARDAAMLAALRRRLADEPAILAPAPALRPPAPRARPGWMVPTAVAAGFVAVAGVLLVSRLSAPEPAAPAVLATRAQPAAGLQRVGTAPAAGPALVLDGQLIRDAQLDAYLRAHRDMRGSAAAAVPGGALRSVETIAPRR
jgi:sigma-E factor negative regulatory protein RseA